MLKDFLTALLCAKQIQLIGDTEQDSEKREVLMQAAIVRARDLADEALTLKDSPLKEFKKEVK